jgi:Eukaryotic aspartyl protease
VQGATNNAQVGGYTYPCSTIPPDFGISIGPSYTAVIPGAQVTFAQVDTKTCFGGVQSNGGSNLQIYGDVFFRSQYVVFDGQNKALHIAPKA